jgi:proline iminopeptidase
MWDYLEPVARPLDGLVSTHRYDQRGCGRSSPDDDYRMDRFVADLDELRASFGYQRWYVIGHSFGAEVGLAYASTHPDRVSGLVYCDGVGLDWVAHRAAYHARADARLTDSQKARRDRLERLERSRDEEVEWRTLCWMPDFADPDRAEAMARRDAAEPLPINMACNHALGAEAHQRSRADQRAACARVRAPVLVIHGRDDPRPLDGVHALVDALPTAELSVVADAGHQPWREQPGKVDQLLRDFLGP